MFTGCSFRTQVASFSSALSLQRKRDKQSIFVRRALLEQSSGALLPSTSFSASDLSSIDPAAVLRDVDLEKVKESFAVLEQYGGQAAGAAGAALQGLFSPFQVFGDSVYLNLMFFGTLGLLAYSLLINKPGSILAPRQ